MAELKQERAIRTRQTIISAAAEVFDEHGYNGASMREIMKRARVTLGAVYFHFPSKEALAQAVMNAQPQTIMPQLSSRGLQRLVDITLLWSHQLQVDPILRAGVRLTGEQTSFGLRDVTPYQEWEQIMEECLLEARELGELREHIDPREVAELVVETCTGMQMYSDMTSRRSDLSQRTVRMWQLLIPVLATENAGPAIEVNTQRVAALTS